MTTTWWNTLKSGLQRSSANIGSKFKSIFTNRKIDFQTLDELEELLIQSDMGVEVAAALRKDLSTAQLEEKDNQSLILQYLAGRIEDILKPVEVPLTLMPDQLNVILMVGVNGSGKTTTIGKLAQQWTQQGLKVSVAACDTFRAAASEQLEIWAKRTGVDIYSGQDNQDPSSVAFEAVQTARQAKKDVLIIDTAGRLQNKDHLMQELSKMSRVIKKIIPDAPHHNILILDATTGQNALSQIEAFTKAYPLSGLIITKLDGTAKGGIVVKIAQHYKLAIHAIGVGETLTDLQPFNANLFARALLGVEPNDKHI